MAIDPRKLNLVLEVAEQGSISRAAVSLRIAQPSLSRAIKEFEAALGVQIFKREPRGVTVTADGDRLVRHARNIRRELQRAEMELAAAHPPHRKEIAIGIVPVHPIDPLVQSLLSLVEANPDIRARFVTGTREQLLEPLSRGDIDLILGPLTPALRLGGILETVIYFEDLAIYCGPANPLFGREDVPIENLAGMKWILGPAGSPSRQRVDAFFKAQGIAPPRVDIEFEEVPARRATVLHSDYLSVFQRQHVLNEIRERQIYPLPVPWQQEERPIGITQLAAAPLSQAAQDFVDTVRQTFARSGVCTELHLGSAPDGPADGSRLTGPSTPD